MTTCIQPAQVINGTLQFPFFYHMTHKNNLAGILKHGILSHTAVVYSNEVLATDISDPGAQKWRAGMEPSNHRAIHDYVPLYINPKNPMLYKRRNMQSEIVILKISREILRDGQHVFSDGNAACRDTKFSRNPNIVAESLDVLYASYWANFAEGKRRRCAELLVYPKVRPVHILSAICNNDPLAKEIAIKTNLEIEIDPSFFF